MVNMCQLGWGWQDDCAGGGGSAAAWPGLPARFPCCAASWAPSAGRGGSASDRQMPGYLARLTRRTAREGDMSVKRRGVAAVCGLAGCVLVAVAGAGGLTSAAGVVGAVRVVGPGDWPAYLAGPAHTSDRRAQVAITPGSAGSVVRKWHFAGDPPTQPGQPRPPFDASPTVADGAVFIGSQTGWFYKLDERTGKVLAKVFFGFQPPLTCPAAGFIGTATVARDPADGQDTVYVGAPDGYLYALRAADLSRKWRSPIAIPSATVSNYFQWSSPTVAGGRIYIGVSSHCDSPLVRGGVIGYRQGTGKIIARYFDVPE